MKAWKRATFVATITAAVLGARAEESHMADGHDHHAFHRHHVAVFVGGTHDYHDEDAFTVGMDYEYRFTELFGAGVLIDVAGGDIESAVIGGGLFIHPWKELRFLTAVGKEFHNGHGEFVVRLGSLYDFHIDQWALSPAVLLDVLESGHLNVVYGLGIGRGF